MKRITKKDYVEYLKTLNPRKIAGKVRNAYECPFAIYLKTLLVNKEYAYSVTVQYTGYSFRNSTRHVYFDNPRWLRNFVAAADGAKTKTITAEKALQILQSV